MAPAKASALEVEFWKFLASDTVSLKQRIPDVAVFTKRHHFDGWWHTTKTGLLAKKQNGTIDQFLQRVLQVAEERHRAKNLPFGTHTPAAILRKVAPVAGSQDKEGCPVAVILTAGEVSQVIDSVKNRSFDDCDVFSIQAIVEPFEDQRVVSVYSCDLMGEERSDIFGRTFEKVYPIEQNKPIEIQTPGDVEADKCQTIAPNRRQLIESKTLALVRFVRRNFEIALDGFIAEFLVDKDNKIVLHGVWSATVYKEGNMVPQDPGKKLQQRQQPSKAYPFPTDRVKGITLPEFRFDPNTTKAHSTLHEERRKKKVGEREADELIDRIVGNKRKGDEPELLLEVWSEEDYLGEIMLPKLSDLDSVKGPKSYRIGKPDSKTTRMDGKKTRFMNDSSVTLELKWQGNGEPFQNELRLLLSHGQFAMPCNPRVQLWLREDGEYTPLWTSQVHKQTAFPQFKEQADLKIELKETDGAVEQWQKTKKAAREGAEAAIKPLAAVGTSAASGSTSKAAPARARSAGPSKLSANTHVAGARLGQHWGVDSTDAVMSTHVLAAQVLSRYQTERTNRCTMLSVLARQLERFRDVQLSWQEQRMAARAAVSKAQQDIVEKEEQCKLLIKEKEELVRDYKKRLEAMFRGVTRDMDDMKQQKVIAENKLAESLQREAEQTRMIEKLELRNSALRVTIDKTMHKMNQLSDGAGGGGDGAAASRSDGPRMAMDSEDGEKLLAAQEKIKILEHEKKALSIDADSARVELRKMYQEKTQLEEKSQKLEQFIRNVALKP
ncbi:unnamed protein product [Amoebophrya sp. A25]|nr:unnamed protein product [Amoebophrya sp. A25]|eukprot:GSA25T00003885001.1